MFYLGERGLYCRKCIKFGTVAPKEDDIKEVDAQYHLKFELTQRQKEVSDRLCFHFSNGRNVLLEAVCGRGKTELVFAVISMALKQSKHVGMTIARRQVVLEIASRLQEAFPAVKVTPVCMGFTADTDGDLIICTTHQLYRFTDYFDLLIIDEPDAFPFKGNEVLQGLAERSCRGNRIYLTATPDQQLKEAVLNNELEHLYLSRRPHGHDLCVPEVYYGNKADLLIKGSSWLRKQLTLNRKIMIFVPSMRKGKRLYHLLKPFVSCCYVSSMTEGKDELISMFKKGKYRVIITTLILERGITVENVRVMVYLAENRVFDEAALTQISGRAGRSFRYPDGDCLFLCEGRSESIDACISSIVRANND